MSTKREFLRQQFQSKTLQNLGFTDIEANQLRRISMTLQRWYDLECGTEAGHIERDEETGKPYRVHEYKGKQYRTVTPDRETGAIKRLKGIIHARNTRQAWLTHPILSYYIQTDPRGAALYIIRPNDIPEGYKVEECYSRGICVY